MPDSTILLPEFRPIGALGNNLHNPALDPVVGGAELKIAPAHFAPGTGDALIAGPNPRTISNVVSGGHEDDPEDPKLSAWIYTLGQFVDHDLDLETVNKTSIDIPVPAGDPNFADGSTIGLTRAVIDPKTHTVTNTVAGYLDLSQVYGSDEVNAASLRNADGTMKTTAGDNLPIVGRGFVSGDVRVTENPELTAITTMFVREHNYWVAQLHAANPTWNGDQLYGMAKAITTAEYQNVVYSEFLPALIGDKVGKYLGYDPTVNSQVTQEFSTAAFRVGHSQVSDTQTKLDNDGKVTGRESLFQSFFNTPALNEIGGGASALIRNFSSDPAQMTDVYAIGGLRNLLATDPDKMDLIAIDIQRERDLGIGTLNDTRTALGLDRYTSFSQLTDDPAVRASMESVFGNIDAVDLFMGGLAENHVAGAVVGQTFQAIIGNQFEALRDGDRFFWQNQAFDEPTRKIIAGITLGDIVERTTGTPVEQQNVFLTAERHASELSTANAADDDPAAAQLVVGNNLPDAIIAGGAGDDTLVSGSGVHQSLTGGGGADTFVFLHYGDGDVVTDFNPADDRLQFQSSMATAPLTTDDPAMKVTLADLNGSTLVTYNGHAIDLWGVASANLHGSNFVAPPGSFVELIHS